MILHHCLFKFLIESRAGFSSLALVACCVAFGLVGGVTPNCCASCSAFFEPDSD